MSRAGYSTTSMVIDFFGGTPIDQAAATAQDLADEKDCSVRFQFNGVECTAFPGGNAERLAQEQQEAQAYQPRAVSK